MKATTSMSRRRSHSVVNPRSLEGSGSAGFTIIETVLFLAISGALAVGILVSANTLINQQRYRDAVAGLKSDIQQLYAETEAPVNDRSGVENCKPNAEVIVPGAGGFGAAQDRGTTDCLLMGRVLTIQADGQQIDSAQVIGKRRSGTPPLGPTESETTDVLTNYDLTTSPIGQSNDQIDWAARAVSAGSDDSKPLTVMVLRLPVSGAITTLYKDGATTNLNSMTVVTSPVLICVKSSTSFVGRPLGVRIGAYAASQSAIEIPSESEAVCG